MSYYLGIDTSNYTTSVALYNDEDNSVVNLKQLLPVKSGEKGIRQSDAVFHHTVQLPQLIKSAFDGKKIKIEGVGVSTKPCNVDNSYMPCFLTGVSVATAIASALNLPMYEFSHQDGHIVAALYSSEKLDLINERFIAFHVSGGTSQALFVEPDDKYFKTTLISDSLDLKAGQAVDRVGVMLGLNFPCGPELEKLALQSSAENKKIKVFRRDGCFSLSGVENKCKKMFDDGENPADIALYCLNYIHSALEDSVIEIVDTYGSLPIVFSGGVMSNTIIRNRLKERFDAYFAEPQYSSDNACGIAILASICDKKE